MNNKAKKFLNVLNSKPVIGAFIFVMLSLAMVFAGNVVVKDGSVEVGEDMNVSNTLFVDGLTGKVGIGVTHPNAKLEVGGDLSVDGNIFGGGIYFYSSGEMEIETDDGLMILGDFAVNNGDKFRINPSVPATSTSSCMKGEISWDSSYIYVCINTNTWKRTTLSSW